MYDGILKLQDGTYKAFVKIQDGTEESQSYKTLEEAQDWYKDCHKVMNHNKIKRKNIPVYEYEPVVEYRLKQVSGK